LVALADLSKDWEHYPASFVQAAERRWSNQMNQPDQSSPLPNEQLPKHLKENKLDRKAAEKPVTQRREWLPEDDDDWYEPDYPLSDRRRS
jgi:hypothetical protein